MHRPKNRTVFARLLMKLTDLRTLGSEHADLLFPTQAKFIQTGQIKPNAIFDVPMPMATPANASFLSNYYSNNNNNNNTNNCHQIISTPQQQLKCDGVTVTSSNGYWHNSEGKQIVTTTLNNTKSTTTFQTSSLNAYPMRQNLPTTNQIGLNNNQTQSVNSRDRVPNVRIKVEPITVDDRPAAEMAANFNTKIENHQTSAMIVSQQIAQEQHNNFAQMSMSSSPLVGSDLLEKAVVSTFPEFKLEQQA